MCADQNKETKVLLLLCDSSQVERKGDSLSVVFLT